MRRYHPIEKRSVHRYDRKKAAEDAKERLKTVKTKKVQAKVNESHREA
jgi:hypothetical protein